jgi:hypothetical protein
MKDIGHGLTVEKMQLNLFGAPTGPITNLGILMTVE